MILKLPTWREGGTQLELGLAQCYRHVAHLPLGAELTVTGIDALLTTKVSSCSQYRGYGRNSPEPVTPAIRFHIIKGNARRW